MKFCSSLPLEFEMFSSIFFIIVCTFQPRTAAGTDSATISKPEAGTVTINGQHYNLAFCNNVVVSNDSISQIKIRESCVNFYPEVDCQGGFIRYETGFQFNGGDYAPTLEQPGEIIKVASVGPCFNSCDSRNWKGASTDSVEFTIYEHPNYRGYGVRRIVTGDECVVLPDEDVRYGFGSIKISGTPSSSCTELHYDPRCAGPYTQLRPGYPSLNDLYDYNYPRMARAASRCGSFCNRTVPDVNPAQSSSPEENQITLYSFRGYYGNPTHINLGDGACVNTGYHDWIVSSVQTYGLCVELFTSRNCTRGNEFLKTGGGNVGVDYYANKIMSSTFETVQRTGSVQLCRGDDETNATEPSTPTSSWESGSQPRSGPEVVEIYDHEEFYGIPTQVNLTGVSCFALPEHFMGSIYRHRSACVVLYTSPNCTESWGFYSMRIGDPELGVDYYLGKMLTDTFPSLNLRARSIRLCNTNEGNEDKNSAPQLESTSWGLISISIFCSSVFLS